MNKYIKLAERIQSMTAKEIIQGMTNALRNPKTDTVDFSSFGHIEDGLSCGCAATQLILTLGEFDPKEVLPPNLWGERRYSSPLIPSEGDTGKAKFVIQQFEFAIDELRYGNLELYNKRAVMGSFAEITEYACLPMLDASLWEDDLELYDKFAESL